MIAEVKTGIHVPLDIRRATPADGAALRAMYRRFEPKAEALGLPPLREDATDRWLEQLSSQPNFLVWSEARVVGHAVICPEGESAEVAVFVHQDYRGRGLGRQLLQTLIAEANRIGVRRVWGIAAPDNIPMLHLAYACGFIPGEEMGEFYLLLP